MQRAATPVLRYRRISDCRAARAARRTRLWALLWPLLPALLCLTLWLLPAQSRAAAPVLATAGEDWTRDEIELLAAGAAALAFSLALARTRGALGQARRLASELAEREHEYRLLFDHHFDGVIQTRADDSVLSANRAACEIFGLSEAQLIATDRMTLVDASDPRLAALQQEKLAHGRVRGNLRLRRADGSCFEAELSTASYRGADGSALNSVVVRDVSERHRAESELRLLKACVEQLNDIVIVTEAEPFGEPGPRIVFVNEAFTRLTGYTREEAIGRTPRMLQGPKTDRAELARMGTALRRWENVRGEVINYTKDGREFWLELQIVPLARADGWFTHWVAIERDITARKLEEQRHRDLEQQLRASQKMEAIGTLAGGIAHDFNNILGAVVGHVALAKADLGPDHPVCGALEQVHRGADRARGLVRQILSFSRRESTVMKPQALAPLVRETGALLGATLPATVTLDLNIADTSLVVMADATQMQQVLMNLCTNAWQALGGSSGRVTVTLQPLQQFAPDQPVAGLAPGPYARLAVADTGAGMDEATLARIFDPFFTTKKDGEGTGLGLAVVHGIVGAHHGHIAVRSKPGAGSCFELFFPCVDVDAPDDNAAPATTASADEQGHSETVLYVDDDEVMLLMMERLLQRLGYRPHCIGSPGEALQLLRDGAQHIDALVTDFNMPGLSGLDLARAARELRPGLPVLLSSGFLSQAARAEAAALGVCALVQKENSLEEIGPALHRALAVGAALAG